MNKCLKNLFWVGAKDERGPGQGAIRLPLYSVRAQALRDPQLAPDQCWHKTQLLQIFLTNMVSNNGVLDKNMYEFAIWSNIFRFSANVNWIYCRWQIEIQRWQTYVMWSCFWIGPLSDAMQEDVNVHCSLFMFMFIVHVAYYHNHSTSVNL